MDNTSVCVCDWTYISQLVSAYYQIGISLIGWLVG